MRLIRPLRDLLAGEEGVVAGFARMDDGVLIAVHFDDGDETVPETSLTVVPVATRPEQRPALD